ncbi:MAG: C40 family peptidase [Actinomycetales bacterium]|nr:C40 family peptidase [Actinomycetales bacterium]
MSAANYLTVSGVTTGGADGVRRALFAYNHADWYVNDVLYYAQVYGGGVIAGDPAGCGTGGAGNPDLAAIPNATVGQLLTWAEAHVGQPYVYGASGPGAWDCSGFTRAAFAQIGISLPRTAAAQHDWVARGNGYQVPLGQEQPGDLIFVDSYLGPNQIGHVMIVYDPARKLTIEAGGDRVGNYAYTYWEDHPLFSIWRVGASA